MRLLIKTTFNPILIQKGSLWKIIKESQDGKLNEPIVKDYTKQIVEGLNYLHSEYVIHRDLKAKNILIDSANVLKLADFGLSVQLRDDLTGTSQFFSNQFSTCLGTFTHMAPEVVDSRKGKYGRKVDIW